MAVGVVGFIGRIPIGCFVVRFVGMA